MGQYYKTIIKDKEGLYAVANDCAFPEYVGIKLMEHSYINNIWCDCIAYKIYQNKCRVAHVGDYANEYPEHLLAYYQGITVPALDIARNFGDDGKFINFNYRHKYLLNHTKKVYVDLDEYMEKSGGYCEGLVVNPITLLTALGNGRGGGDYYEEYPNFDLVGSWAWDEISIENTYPAEYEEFDVYFTEMDRDEWKQDQIKKLEKRIERMKDTIFENKCSDDFYYTNGSAEWDRRILNKLKSELEKLTVDEAEGNDEVVC